MPEKSELEILLEKNAYGGGLTPEEWGRAEKLIGEAKPTEEDCWVCHPPEQKTIYSTGLCKGHANYALITRK